MFWNTLFAAGCGKSSNFIDTSCLPQATASGNEVSTVLGIVFAIVGAIAVLVIVISGFRYITSAGDPQKAAGARNGIIYALVGLAVALTAEAIVNFVIGNL